MKRGFTLVELIGVIVLIAAISLIIIPIVDKNIKDGKKELYQKQIDTIEDATQLWYSNNKLNLADNENMVITLSQLKAEKLIGLNITDPVKNKFFPNDMEISIKKVDGKMVYDVLTDTGTNSAEYVEDMPTITLNGKALEYVQLSNTGGVYTDLGAIAKGKNGDQINYTTTVTPNNVDLTKKGIYTITYSVTDNGLSNEINRTVIVKDTQAPTVTFPSKILSVSLASVKTYDYKKDIIVKDNSNDVINVMVEQNFGVIAGTYTIKYIATDSSGNEATFLRKINVTS